MCGELFKSEVDGMAWQRCSQRWDASDRGEIIPVEEKSKIEMHSAGGNNLCGAKEQDRDAFGRRK